MVAMESTLLLHYLNPSCFIHLPLLPSILLYFIYPCVIRKPHICKTYWKGHHSIIFIFPSKCIFLTLHSFHYRAYVDSELKKGSIQNLHLISLLQDYQRSLASHLSCLKKECYSYSMDHCYLLVIYTINY